MGNYALILLERLLDDACLTSRNQNGNDMSLPVWEVHISRLSVRRLKHIPQKWQIVMRPVQSWE